MNLPRGIYYEAKRRRYRVRLYYGQRILWRSYHTTLEAAVEQLENAKRYRRTLLLGGNLKRPTQPPSALTDLI